MQKTLHLTLFLLFLISTSLLQAQKVEKIEYYSLTQSQSMTEIIKDVFAENKIPVLYFSADWCGPCKKFNKAMAKSSLKKVLEDVVLI